MRAQPTKEIATPGWELATRDAYQGVVILADVIATSFEATNDAEEWQTGDLLARFEASPEARALETHDNWPLVLLDLARIECGTTAGAISADIVEEVVFEIFPLLVSCLPSAALAIITELRACFTYVGRALAFEHAGECLAVLGDGAADDLHDALSDFSSFGAEKLSAMADAEEASDTALTLAPSARPALRLVTSV